MVMENYLDALRAKFAKNAPKDQGSTEMKIGGIRLQFFYELNQTFGKGASRPRFLQNMEAAPQRLKLIRKLQVRNTRENKVDLYSPVCPLTRQFYEKVGRSTVLLQIKQQHLKQ